MTKLIICTKYINPADIEKFSPALEKLLAGQYNSGVNSKLLFKLGELPIYSIRVNGKERLLLVRLTISGEDSWVVTEYLPNHDIKTSTCLKNKDFFKMFLDKDMEHCLAAIESEDFEATEEKLPNKVDTTRLHFIDNKPIIFSLDQQQSLCVSPPALLMGPPGCGKTLVIFEMMRRYCQDNPDIKEPLLCVVPNKRLRDWMEANWRSTVKTQVRVAFKTCEELLPQPQADQRIIDSAAFKKWFQRKCATLKKRSKGSADVYNRLKKQSEFVRYEFGLIKVLGKEEYNKLGWQQSIFTGKEDREAVFRLYEAYRAYLYGQNCYDSFFQTPEFDEKPACVFVDEGQQYLPVHLQGLYKLADQKPGQKPGIVFSLDSEQCLILAPTAIGILKKLFHIMGCTLNVHKLSSTWRCAENPTELANALLEKNHEMDKRSHVYGKIQSATGKKGSCHLYTDLTEETIDHLRRLCQSADTVVITSPENIAELKKKLGTPQVFGPGDILGSNFKNVIIYNLINGDWVKKAGQLSSGQAVKGMQASLQVSRGMNELFVAATRAERKLVFYQQVTHVNRWLIDIIGPLCEQNNQKMEPQDEPAESERTWEQRCEEYLRNGNYSVARAVMRDKLGYSAKKADAIISEFMPSSDSGPSKQNLKNKANENLNKWLDPALLTNDEFISWCNKGTECLQKKLMEAPEGQSNQLGLLLANSHSANIIRQTLKNKTLLDFLIKNIFEDCIQTEETAYGYSVLQTLVFYQRHDILSLILQNLQSVSKEDFWNEALSHIYQILYEQSAADKNFREARMANYKSLLEVLTETLPSCDMVIDLFNTLYMYRGFLTDFEVGYCVKALSGPEGILPLQRPFWNIKLYDPDYETCNFERILRRYPEILEKMQPIIESELGLIFQTLCGNLRMTFAKLQRYLGLRGIYNNDLPKAHTKYKRWLELLKQKQSNPADKNTLRESPEYNLSEFPAQSIRKIHDIKLAFNTILNEEDQRTGIKKQLDAFVRMLQKTELLIQRFLFGGYQFEIDEISFIMANLIAATCSTSMQQQSLEVVRQCTPGQPPKYYIVFNREQLKPLKDISGWNDVSILDIQTGQLYSKRQLPGDHPLRKAWDEKNPEYDSLEVTWLHFNLLHFLENNLKYYPENTWRKHLQNCQNIIRDMVDSRMHLNWLELIFNSKGTDCETSDSVAKLWGRGDVSEFSDIAEKKNLSALEQLMLTDYEKKGCLLANYLGSPGKRKLLFDEVNKNNKLQSILELWLGKSCSVGQGCSRLLIALLAECPEGASWLEKVIEKNKENTFFMRFLNSLFIQARHANPSDRIIHAWFEQLERQGKDVSDAISPLVEYEQDSVILQALTTATVRKGEVSPQLLENWFKAVAPPPIEDAYQGFVAAIHSKLTPLKQERDAITENSYLGSVSNLCFTFMPFIASESNSKMIKYQVSFATALNSLKKATREQYRCPKDIAVLLAFSLQNYFYRNPLDARVAVIQIPGSTSSESDEFFVVLHHAWGMIKPTSEDYFKPADCRIINVQTKTMISGDEFLQLGGIKSIFHNEKPDHAITAAWSSWQGINHITKMVTEILREPGVSKKSRTKIEVSLKALWSLWSLAAKSAQNLNLPDIVSQQQPLPKVSAEPASLFHRPSTTQPGATSKIMKNNTI